MMPANEVTGTKLLLHYICTTAAGASDGNIVDKYRYVSIFLNIKSIRMKTKISINIKKRNVMEKAKIKKMCENPEACWVIDHRDYKV